MKTFAYFLLAGGVAAVLNFCSRIVFNWWMPYPAAIVVSYGVGMLTAFVLNRRFVFTEATNRLGHQVLMFCLINILAVAQTLVVSMTLAYYLLPALGIVNHVREIAHAFGVAVPVLSSYLGHKRWTFKAQRRPQ